jgi:hypothetical protein
MESGQQSIPIRHRERSPISKKAQTPECLTDYVNDGLLQVERIDTEHMVAVWDLLTKPIVGERFEISDVR